jgi:hypothetical protein
VGKPRRRKNKIDATGRNPDAVGKKSSFILVRRSLWLSPLVSALSPSARALMIELLSMYNGANNGELFLSVKDAMDRLGFSDWHAAAAAFGELECVGLITMTRTAYFDIKTGKHSRARTWRLNWIADNGFRLAPQALPAVDETILDARGRKRLRRRQEALKRYFKEMQAGKFSAVDSTILDARKVENPANPAVVSTTPNGQIRANLPNQEMGESTAHPYYHRGLGKGCGPSSRCHPTADRIVARRARLRLAVLAGAGLPH